ncbi:MAG: signal peptidase II [Bacilli bacterium]|nr:signal peptidase II [Bacilli bacterium]
MNKKEDIYKITCIVLLIDQFIKFLVNKFIEINTEIKVIPNFFSIFYVRNKGAAFSILEDNTILIIVISIIFVFILDHYIKAQEKFTKLNCFSLGIILGGIFGNLLDRIIYHSVIDYLAFNVLEYTFPIFNLADIGITIGTCLLIIEFIKEEGKKKKNHEGNIKRNNKRS